MADETVLDYLGHPCQLTEALNRYGLAADRVRDHEPRNVKRRVGVVLMDLSDRIENEPHALTVMRDALPNNSDQDGVRALLTMAISHANETAAVFATLAGLVLAALEHVDTEVSHG